MSDDLIKRSDAIEALKGREGILHDTYTAVAIIRSVPSADRPQGEWIKYYPPMSDMQKSMCGVKEKGYVPDKRFGRAKCSLCGCGRPMYEDNYCPNCGCLMKGADDE